MKIYYRSSIRNKREGLSGLPQQTNWQFEFAGTERYIPAIYHFSRGIVFDVITLLDEAALHEFYSKYEAIEESLTPLQKRSVEQEHPYQAVQLNEIWINGRRVDEGYSSSSIISTPWEEQDNILKSLRESYSVIPQNKPYFACNRFCVPYPQPDNGLQKLLRILRLEKINNFMLSTYPVKRFFPLDIHFNMTVDEQQKELSFHHPLTGIKHILYFQNPKLREFPMNEEDSDAFFSMHAMYNVDPPLPQSDTLQFQSNMQYTKPPSNTQMFSPTAAVSIGIIGGASGPTAFFHSSKGEKTNSNLRSCFSVPSFQRENTAHFVLEGINIKKYDSQEHYFS